MKHQFKCILNSILQQHSYYTVKLLDIYGILDIDSVTEYADYASNKDKNCKLIILGNSIFVACQRNLRENTEIMVIASLTTKSFWNISYYAHGKLIKTIPLSNVEEDCIDLSESGKRWEGQAYEKKPCGWGSYYNEENILVYRGFAFQDNWIGYGIEYWNDIQQPIPKYDGSFCFGMKFGKGKVYDRKGKYLGKRGYLNDEVCENIIITVPNQTIDTLFHNTLMSVFIIGDECYPHHSSFLLSGYPYLTTVRIGNNCYTTSEHKHCRFCITNCNLLKRVEIGDDSFSFFDSCIFRNLAALEYCSFGKLQDSCHSFENCKELIFQNLPNLIRIEMGDYCFMKQHYTCFDKLDSLQYLLIGNQCLLGDENHVDALFRSKNSFIMKDLPSLISFVGNEENLQDYQTVTLTSIDYFIYYYSIFLIFIHMVSVLLNLFSLFLLLQ